VNLFTVFNAVLVACEINSNAAEAKLILVAQL